MISRRAHKSPPASSNTPTKARESPVIRVARTFKFLLKSTGLSLFSLSLFQTSDFLLRTICRYVCYVPLWNLTPATSYSFIAGSLTLLSYNEIYHSHCDSGSGWSLEWSKRQRFRTAAADDSPYTFLAGGDIGAYDSTLAVYSLSLFLI
jgi:hypothetical protein